jgi:hypothetical protein
MEFENEECKECLVSQLRSLDVLNQKLKEEIE